MIRVLAVAVLLLLAGCNAPAGPADPSTATRTVTPVPVPADGSTTTPDGQFAPGVRDDGVDGERLAGAHARALANASYAVNQTLVQRYANGTLRSRYVTVARFTETPGRFAATLRQTDRRDGRLVERTVRRYGDGDAAYAAITEENATRYRRLRWPDGEPRDPQQVYPENLTNVRSIARVFTLVETRVVDTVEMDGTRYARVESAPNATLPPLANVSVTALVSERGVIRSYRVTYDVSRSEESVRATVAVSYTRVGETTVSEPPWLDRVDNRTAVVA